MKLIIKLLVATFIGTTMNMYSQEVKNFHDFNMTSIEGTSVSLADFSGKYVLVVNTASRCGYTKQYAELQELYELHGDKLVVIGFPCNDFGRQEPGTANEIMNFCQKNYGVTFPLSEKVSVKDGTSNLYEWLTNEELNGVLSHKISWNFNKFLIGPNGQILKAFGSSVKPLSSEIVSMLI